MHVRVDTSPIHGRGVFANMDIPDNWWQYLYGYLDKLYPDDPREHFAFMWDETPDGQVWVPYPPWCFLNHEEEPNCDWWLSSDDPDEECEAPMLYIAVNRLILKDEELTINYGYDPAAEPEGYDHPPK